MRRYLSTAALFLLTTCSLPPFDRTEFACPCEEGFSCIRSRCVEPPPDLGELRAFPGALGYGRNTTGGRGGEVLHVTNLDDGGPGSLRSAIATNGTRTIVFDVAGEIVAPTPLVINEGDLTIAGETAPGDGITIRGSGLDIHGSNVIVRYLRIRVGTEHHDPDGEDMLVRDALRLITDGNGSAFDVVDVIVDHCSLSWATWNNVRFRTFPGSAIRRVTIQHSVAAEPIRQRHNVRIDQAVEDVSIVNNYLAHFSEYAPSTASAGAHYELINNVIYDGAAFTTACYGTKADVIGNIYKNAPEAANEECCRYIPVYMNDTVMPAGDDVHQSDNQCVGIADGLMSRDWREYNSETRIHTESVTTPLPSAGIDDVVLQDVGASALFADPVDERLLADYANGTGRRADVRDTEAVFGGFPPLTMAERPVDYDVDRDGMADEWELSRGFDPTDPEDGSADRDGDGYTNLEVFLYVLTQ